MKNNFTDETRSLFIFESECAWCGKPHGNILHHILGRISASPLNASLLNNFECHIGNGKLSQFEIKKMLLQKTLNFLLDSGYSLTKEDKSFMKKYKKYYED